MQFIDFAMKYHAKYLQERDWRAPHPPRITPPADSYAVPYVLGTFFKASERHQSAKKQAFCFDDALNNNSQCDLSI